MPLITDFKRPAAANPFAPIIAELAAAPEGSAWAELVEREGKLSVSTTKQKIQSAARDAGYSARFQSEKDTEGGTELVFILGAARKSSTAIAESVEDAPEDAPEDVPAK